VGWIALIGRKILGVVLILVGTDFEMRIQDHRFHGFEAYLYYALFLLLCTAGFYIFLENKYRPFTPWVRMAGALAILNGMSVMLIQQNMVHVHLMDSPDPNMRVGHWVWELTRVLAIPMVYLLVAGERKTKRSKYGTDDPRHIWIRLCGLLILAWACGWAVNIWLTKYWLSYAVDQAERVAVIVAGTALQAAIGAALMFWPHGSAGTNAYVYGGEEQKRGGLFSDLFDAESWAGILRILVAGWVLIFAALCVHDFRAMQELTADIDELIGKGQAYPRTVWHDAEFGKPFERGVLLLMYPGAWLLMKGVNAAGFAGFMDLPWQGTTAALAMSAILSWGIWGIFLGAGAAIFNFVGLYNPFWRQHGILWFWRPLRWWVEWRAAQTYGQAATARLASWAEVMAQPYRQGDIFLGRPRSPFWKFLRPVGIRTERHVCTISGAGGGKSTGAIIPNLLLHEGSALVLDPKAELAAVTWRRRGPGGNGVRGMGQQVVVLDPYGLADGPGGQYDPFDELAYVAHQEPMLAVQFADKIAEGLIKPSLAGGNAEYFDNAARTLMRALVLYIHVTEPPERRNLVRLREMLTTGDREKYQEAIKLDLVNPRKTTPFEFLVSLMAGVDDPVYGKPIASAAESLLIMGEGQLGSVVTTAQENTTFLDFPEMQKVCGSSDFRLGELKEKPLSVYVCLPASAVSGTQGRWLRMFTVLFTHLAQMDTSKPDPPVLLAIDEFANLGPLAGAETWMPLLRGYGVRVWIVVQGLQQLVSVYPNTWEGFIANAEAVQFLSNTEPATVAFIKERLGQHVIRVAGQSYQTWVFDEEQIGRYLAPEKKNQIVWFGRRVPMVLKLCPYYEYFPYWYYDPDKRYREKWNRALWRRMWG
jgi:type IV secretion system protein VirD4